MAIHVGVGRPTREEDLQGFGIVRWRPSPITGHPQRQNRKKHLLADSIRVYQSRGTRQELVTPGGVADAYCLLLATPWAAMTTRSVMKWWHDAERRARKTKTMLSLCYDGRMLEVVTARERERDRERGGERESGSSSINWAIRDLWQAKATVIDLDTDLDPLPLLSFIFRTAFLFNSLHCDYL